MDDQQITSKTLEHWLLPCVPDAWIVADSDGLVATNKPAGLACQAASDLKFDDLFTRLRATRPYVGVHQRLDKETSGVVIATTSTEYNADVAKAFESRDVSKTYIAAVTNWRGGERTLRDQLTKSRGRMQISASGKEATTHVRVLASKGDRTLLEVMPVTGRMHQIRVQLAAVGAPIVGDALYGGLPYGRLMLHAESLELPIKGKSLRFDVAPPAVFKRWLNGKDEAFDAQLARAIIRRSSLLLNPDLNALRLFNGDADGARGVEIDLYDKHAVLNLRDAELAEDIVCDALKSRGVASISIKSRAKQSNVLTQEEIEARTTSEPYGTPPDIFPIIENGIDFPVMLRDGMSTGIFLDQRENRRWVNAQARGKRILNLFSYTCGFSHAAAMGGASEVVSVDLSKRAIERGRELMSDTLKNERTPEFYCMDVFGALKLLTKKQRRFDIIIVDPPTYSNSKKGRWRSFKDWPQLLEAVDAVSEAGATWLLTTNDRRRTRKQFIRMVEQTVSPRDIKSVSLPEDFAAPWSEPIQKSLRVKF